VEVALQDSSNSMIPKFDPRLNRWRGKGGHFMKPGVPLGGWVLVHCERCGCQFPTREWEARERPAHFFCSRSCLTGEDAMAPEFEAEGNASD